MSFLTAYPTSCRHQVVLLTIFGSRPLPSSFRLRDSCRLFLQRLCGSQFDSDPRIIVI